MCNVDWENSLLDTGNLLVGKQSSMRWSARYRTGRLKKNRLARLRLLTRRVLVSMFMILVWLDLLYLPAIQLMVRYGRLSIWILAGRTSL